MTEEHPARRAAQASMAAVVARDRDAWVGLFAPDGFVEDPVGPTDGVSVYRADGDGRLASLRAFWEMDRMLGTIAQP
jgi:hypothetical protein